MKKISIIGCGAIGSELALSIDSEMLDKVKISSLFDLNLEYAENLRSILKNNSPELYGNFSDYVNSKSFKEVDLVIESASQEAVKAYIRKILSERKDILVMSVGSFADSIFYADILKYVTKYDNNIYVPSGAIAGIDAIKSTRNFISSVTLTTTKNPESLRGAPFFQTSEIDLDSLKKRTNIFEGSAVEAVKYFPANVNVAALLGLVGLGVEKTKVNIVVDPSIRINKHEIKVTGKFGELIIMVKNIPSSKNPRTSYLAILSALECIRSIVSSGVKYGT
ncbi:MAG TPA: aspartate dehydrogenase [Nitrososphaeraceae archaeon]|nr:aspartate dehydrogenase [Nitrososphaeraceae archaeon]